MSRGDLSVRENWQCNANEAGKFKEEYTIKILKKEFNESYYEVGKPKRMYYEDSKYGFELDAYILNKNTGKIFFLEVKRQNDNGNAQERAYKYHPGGGIVELIKNIVGVTYIPVGFIFYGDMAITKKYVTEISTMFCDYPELVVFDNDTDEARRHLFDHIKECID